MYTLSDFDFKLPPRLIAQEPAHPRDQARLLVYDRAKGTIIDDYFYNLPLHLPTQSTLVLNNSKVEKCRLVFPASSQNATEVTPQIDIKSAPIIETHNASQNASSSTTHSTSNSTNQSSRDIEIFVLETINHTTVRAMVRPGKKFTLHAELALSGGISAKVTAVSEGGLRTIEFNMPLDDPTFDEFRLTPLPPYIEQNEALADEYQTVYASPLGSKAAPTAGLHFTPELLDRIKQEHAIAEITLHVGMGTFAPVKTNDLSNHVMHEEWFSITKEASQLLNAASHITAVGTTSVRTLESADHPFGEQTKATDIFITPGYKFTKTNALITNFHLPKSTLLMLVSAFIGDQQPEQYRLSQQSQQPVEELQRIYAHAIRQEYRFYSFGDAMLIV